MTTTKKVPQRSCIGCGLQKDKKSLIRIVRTGDGEYSIDSTGRKNGRGAYICPSCECLDLVIRKKGLDRSFKESVGKEVYESLAEEMKNFVQG